MSIRDLKTFLAVIETGSFAAASQIVRRTQSAITMQMKSLESELGYPLFDRSKRPPVLNDAGRGFAVKAAEAVRTYEALFREPAGAPIEGQLRLGVVPGVITGVMPRALVTLRTQFPSLHTKLTMGLSADLVDQVTRGKLDAAIVSDMARSTKGLRWSPFLREPLVLIAPMDAPLKEADQLASSYPFIRYNKQAWVGQLIDKFLKRRRLKVNEAMTLDTLEAIATMVHYGLGVSVVPLPSFTGSLSLPVRTVAFSGAPVYRVIGVVQQSAHSKSAFTEILLRELTSLSSAASSASNQTLRVALRRRRIRS